MTSRRLLFQLARGIIMLEGQRPNERAHCGSRCSPCRFVTLPHGCRNGASCAWET